MLRPGRFTPGKDPVPIVYEDAWIPGSFWTGAENFAYTGIRSLDRPAHSESLYVYADSQNDYEHLLDIRWKIVVFLSQTHQFEYH